MRRSSIALALIFAGTLLPGACGGTSRIRNPTTTGTTSSTTTGSTTASGTGGSGGVSSIAACDAPASPPSKGACFLAVSTGTGGSQGTGGSTGTGGAGGLGGAGGAGGDASGAGGAGTTTASATTSAGGSPPDCSMILASGDCATCLTGQCCAELAACDGAPSCLACVLGAETNPAKCEAEPAKAAAAALIGCLTAACPGPCVPPQCNPLTNEGCDAAAGEACDLGPIGFRCFPAPNDQPLCAPCDLNAGPFCAPGMHCLKDGACARYCCDDGDCGSGACDRAILDHPAVGVCVEKK